jgi:hypothetical protein
MEKKMLAKKWDLEATGIKKSIITKMLILSAFLSQAEAYAQLTIDVAPPKIVGDKAIVSLVMKNNLPEKVQSAKAALFLMDDQGKVVGLSTRWVIGGTRNVPGLSPGATNNYNFVITSPKPFVSTNLTAKVQFSRVILAGGKLVNVAQEVKINNGNNK